MIADYFIHWTFDYPEPVQLLHGGVSDNLNFTVAVATARLATKRRMETEERKTKRKTSRIEAEESAERLETKCLKKARLKQGQSKRRGTMSAPSQYVVDIATAQTVDSRKFTQYYTSYLLRDASQNIF